jgi:two-component sensor histidine kinase
MERTVSSPVVDRIISWSIDNPLSAPARYLAATLLVVVAGVVRAAFITSLLPWLLFIPIILGVALTMGRRTGLYAVVVSALAAALGIPHPGATFWLTNAQWVASALFIAVNAMIVTVAAEVRAGFMRARQASADYRQLAEQREQDARELAVANASLLEKEEQAKLLTGELGHRLKNLLAIVQAVASQTLRQATDLSTATDALSFRLAALGRATDVLTASSWEAADMHTLVRSAIGGHASGVRLDGPPIRFNAQISLALALALHELATNATKYGALSNGTGYVDLCWVIRPGDTATDDPRFILSWREVGGPPVEPPSRRGFGSLLIERSLRSYFRGSISMNYEPSGLVFTIDAPLAGAGMEVP